MSELEGASTDAGSEGNDLPPVSERRVHIRYPRRLELLCQFLGVPSSDMASATLFDLSVSGAGLHSERPFPVGKTLFIRLHSSTMGWTSLLARVKHCREILPGQFQIGCLFVKPLNREQLRVLLT
jgi:hypothetical protein